MRVVLKKSVAEAICRYWGFPCVLKAVRDPKLEYFKRKILEHLDKLERKEKAQMRKSLAYLERLEKAQKRNVGDIVTWGRKVQHKYIKGADGKWRRYYEGTSRGQKLSIAALKRKVDACKDTAELWDLVFANWGRFMDADKMPLPVVRELHAYASKREDEIKAWVIDKPRPERKKKLTPEEEEDAKLNAMSDEELKELISVYKQQAEDAAEIASKTHEDEFYALMDRWCYLVDKYTKTEDKRVRDEIDKVSDEISDIKDSARKPFTDKIEKIQNILKKRFYKRSIKKIERLRANRKKMISERKAKSVPRGIEELQDFDFVKNGLLSKKELKDFTEDYKRLTPEGRMILEGYAKRMKVDFHYKPKNPDDPKAFFDVSNNTVCLNIQPEARSKDEKFKTNMVIFLHETGHWLDWNILRPHRVRDELPKLRELLNSDAVSFLNDKILAKPNAITSLQNIDRSGVIGFNNFITNDTFGEKGTEQLKKDVYCKKEAVSDIMMGLMPTQDRAYFTYAHTEAYWKSYSESLEAETLAHFFAAYIYDGEKETFLKEVFPSAYKYFEDFVKNLY